MTNQPPLQTPVVDAPLTDPAMLPAVTIRRSDYRPPDYLTPSVHLKFDLDLERTVVTSVTRFKRQPGAAHDAPLRLDGDGLELLEIALDGITLDSSRYSQADDALLLRDPPAEFDLTIVAAIAPASNLQLSGLYASNGMLITQCEAQGFRRITYFQDRPDVMARYRVELHADKQQFPVLLSNGNLVQTSEDRRTARRRLGRSVPQAELPLRAGRRPSGGQRAAPPDPVGARRDAAGLGGTRQPRARPSTRWQA